VDAETGKTVRTSTIGGRPYDVVLAPNGKLLLVSDWAGKRVVLLDPENFAMAGSIAVGDHPNQMVAHPKDNRVFVACASSNKISVIDTLRGIVIEEIHTALFPRAPEGSTPCALALDPAGKTLYVACADNNAVAVIDVETREDGKPASAVKGFIPTGWYPTAVTVSPNGKQLLVGVGKGNQSKPNPVFTEQQKKAVEKDEVRSAARRLMPYPYIGTTMSGSLSIVEIPDEAKLKEHTAQVYRNCPYSDSQLTTAPSARKTAIPTRVGDKSPIEHVIYIIKENRTYDQVFGDIPGGNADKSLVMFGEKITPNHHKLAKEYVLLDNLYCNGQVSRDGHPWSTAAYHTDYIARDWHLTYSRRKGVEDDDEGHLSNPPSGYLWDACKRAGLSYRSYGEYGKRVSEPDGSSRMEGRVPGLVGHFAPKYGLAAKPGTKVRDTHKVDSFLEEFRDYEKNNNLPRFMVVSLGEDHTSGTTPGAFTPEACVASNDLALGRLVDAVSKSSLWAKTAIFVIEDDAQNGPDHVDAHRTIGLVISPYVRRKHIDSTQYATVSMIRTMELILGLPPLSQYDAAARPMFESFTDKPDLTTYAHVPANIDLDAVNKATAYGAARSAKMDFTEYDRIDDFELNEILWRHVKGANAPLPPAVRRAIAFRSQPTK
jgi:YVTN family beta-propeller protein